ncbi:hypothetical protein ACFLU6_02315 [Acidobacteriota bacterium]
MRREAANIPYVPVVGFEKALQALKKAKPGDAINKASLERKDVAGNTYYQVVNAMKFLKMIDKNKKVTANLQLWLTDRASRLKLVQTSYKPLLDTLKMPVKDNTVIKKVIKEQYDMADSVILLATTFFTWAARQGGMNVLEGDRDGIARRGRGAKPGLTRRKVGRPRKKTTAASRDFGFGGRGAVKGIPPVLLNVNLQISKETRRVDIKRMLTDLKEELKEL